MNRLDRQIMASLRMHPHDDMPAALYEALKGPGVDLDAIAASLEDLRRSGLVITADDHWQLTAAGWRMQRAA
jgi:hypothetical protein